MTPERLRMIATVVEQDPTVMVVNGDHNVDLSEIYLRDVDDSAANIIRELLDEIDRLNASVVLRVGDDTYAWTTDTHQRT